jgi:hypothetical protein
MAIALGLLALGTFLATAGWWLHRLRRVAIPDNRGAFLLFWAVAVVSGVASFFVPQAGWLSATAGAVGAAGGALMLALYALGGQRAGDAIAVGETMPPFTAPDEHGVAFQSASLAGTLALIKFFRGHW